MENPNSRRNDWYLAGVILAIGLALRLVYLHQYEASPLFRQVIGPDVSDYLGWSGRILSGQMLWDKVNIHAPLYPYYLALLNWLDCMNLYWTRLLQMMLALAAFLPLFFELRYYYRRGPWILLPPYFLVLAAVYTPLIFYSGELISEALMVPLLCLGIAGLYRADRTKDSRRWLWYAGAGLAFGLAGITHPLSLITGVACGLLLPARRRGAAAVFAAAAILPVAAVSGYNTWLEKTPVLVQKNSGYNLYLGNNPAATGGCYIWPGPDWDKVHEEAKVMASKSGMTKDQYFLLQVRIFVVHHPLEWLKLVGRKALYAWNHVEAAAGPDLPKLKYFTPLMDGTSWLGGVVMMLALGGLLLLVVAGRRARREWWRGRYLILSVLGGWLVLALTVVGGRYRLMLLPGTLFLCSWVLLYMAYGWAKKHWLCREGLLLLALVAVWLPQMKIDDAVERNQADTILGEAYLNDGKREKALEYLQAAEKGLSRWSRSYNLLGRYYETSDLQRAESYYRKAIECSPGEAYGYMNLGNMSSVRKDNAAAEKWFARALWLGRDDPQVLYNVGYYALQRGDIVRARTLLEKCLAVKPDDRRALNAAAVAALMQNRPAEAIAFLQTALRLDPRNTGVMLNLAMAWIASGDRERATQWLEKVLQLEPGNPGALELKRRLFSH